MGEMPLVLDSSTRQESSAYSFDSNPEPARTLSSMCSRTELELLLLLPPALCSLCSLLPPTLAAAAYPPATAYLPVAAPALAQGMEHRLYVGSGPRPAM